MKCPYCKQDNNFILDTRESTADVKRRRECKNCGRRFNTHEVIAIAKKGRPYMGKKCAYCGKMITGWGYFYRPDRKWFHEGGSTRDQDGICLKNYLFEKYQNDIKMTAIESDEEFAFAERCRNGG
jgi:NAD-dependent SIR2 family protein deacetylase